MKNIGCSGMIAIAFVVFLVGTLLAQPGGIFVILAILAVAIIGVIAAFRAGKKNRIAKARETAELLEVLAGQLSSGGIKSDMSLRPNEEIIATLPAANLIEYKSQGSKYSGGTSGFGLGITENVNFNLGWQNGSIEALPEVLSVIDSGEAFVTNQRMLFRGQSNVREWDYANYLGVTLPTAWSALVAVSDREQIAGVTPTFNDVIPVAMLLEIGLAFNRSGVTEAAKKARQLAQELRELAVEQEAASKIL